MLGWNPGTDQELFTLNELVEAFSIEKIGKSGSRFDYDKAKWFNQQYIMAASDETLSGLVRPMVEEQGYHPQESFLQAFCGMMKERVVVLSDFWDAGRYFFEDVLLFDEKTIAKKWDAKNKPLFEGLISYLETLEAFDPETVHQAVEAYMQEKNLKPGDVFPILRIALIGTMKGPGVAEMLSLFGPAELRRRLNRAFDLFDALVSQ